MGRKTYTKTKVTADTLKKGDRIYLNSRFNDPIYLDSVKFKDGHIFINGDIKKRPKTKIIREMRYSEWLATQYTPKFMETVATDTNGLEEESEKHSTKHMKTYLDFS